VDGVYFIEESVPTAVLESSSTLHLLAW